MPSAEFPDRNASFPVPRHLFIDIYAEFLQGLYSLVSAQPEVKREGIDRPDKIIEFDQFFLCGKGEGGLRSS